MNIGPAQPIRPGSLLLNLNNRDWGLLFVVAARTMSFPGPWTQLTVTAIDSKRNCIVNLEHEVSAFSLRWMLVI